MIRRHASCYLSLPSAPPLSARTAAQALANVMWALVSLHWRPDSTWLVNAFDRAQQLLPQLTTHGLCQVRGIVRPGDGAWDEMVP